MADLDKLLADYMGAYLNYPQVRREKEGKLMAALVAEVKALREPRIRPIVPEGGPYYQVPEAAWTEVTTPAAIDEAVRAEMVKRKPGRPPKAEAA